MPSQLRKYEYDIFISYRHNDNRSGWVTEFVEHPKEELAATIKVPLSIYFDKNPHDGILETDNVYKSLERKLNCLIFIPIISQTYCDQNSFAWVHEFVAFNKLAQADELGRDIRLRNGNVASRILPVIIHDLDADDRNTIENEIHGALRGVEFMYQEPGVCRALLPGDDRKLNQNKSDYRNQINKITLAIKELQNAITSPLGDSLPKPPKKTTASGLKINAVLLAVVFLILTGILIYWLTLPTQNITSGYNKNLDRAEQYFEEGGRFEDERYYKQAMLVIRKVLAEDSLNERALYLMATSFDGDSADYFINKLARISPDGTFTQLSKSDRAWKKGRPQEAIKILKNILAQQHDNLDALRRISFITLLEKDYVNAYTYSKRLEAGDQKSALGLLSTLYMEVGDFKTAYRLIQRKQELQEFACSDVEGFQKILLCEGDFEKLEIITDSLCNFSNCPDCPFWKLRAKVHVGKYAEAGHWVKPTLERMEKLTWRYPAFVLLRTGKKDSANLIARAELDFDQIKLSDSTNKQSIYLYSMAAINAMQGNAKESLKFLRQYASRGFELGSEWYIAHDPLFDEMQKDNEYFADFIQMVQKEQQYKNSIREELRKLENKTSTIN